MYLYLCEHICIRIRIRVCFCVRLSVCVNFWQVQIFMRI